MENFAWPKLLLVALSMLSTGCCTRYKCVAQVLLVVHGDHGNLLTQADGLTVGDSAPASPCPTTMDCSFYLLGSDYVVGAPGFKPVTVHVDPAQDECGNSVAQTYDVTLVPESDTKSSTLHRTLGDSCGE
jgi:hypothetical protein